MSTITGVAGSGISAVCAVSNNGVQIANGESAATAQSICNDLATIATGTHHFGGNKTFDNDVIVAGSVGINTNLAVAGDETVKGTLTSPAVGSDPAGKAKFLGRVAPRGARQSIATAGVHTGRRLGVAVGTSITHAGPNFELSGEPDAATVVVLDHTHAVPFDGEVVRVSYFVNAASITFTPATPVFKFTREDNTVIAAFCQSADTHFSAPQIMVADFEFSGGVWRLGMNSGRSNDQANTNAQSCNEVGVIPGPSA